MTNGNPYAPSSHQAWANHFTESLSGAFDQFGNKIQLLNKEANEEMVESVQSAMNSLTSAVRTATRNVLKGVIEAQEHLDRRSRLLWWSHTLHSTTLDVSYRALPPEVLPFVVALDAQGLVGPFAPLSVESLIREVIRATECKRASVPDLASALADAPEPVSNMATPYAVGLDGQLPVVRYLAAQAAGAQTDGWVDASTDDRGEDVGDLAVWIYRSAQAHRLAFDA